jgi:hypothetical protein
VGDSNIKICKACFIAKPIYPTYKKDSKAYGFRGRLCWSCYCAQDKETSKIEKQIKRKTEEGKLRMQAQYQKWLATPKGRADSNKRARERRQYIFKFAQPVWADKAEIAKIYGLAKKVSDWAGHRFVVDHIVPIKGQTVCGLHVHTNLQILPWHINASKSNYYV